MMKDLYSPAEIHRGEGNLNVANVEVLPVANANTQLETGNIGTGNTITMATLENSLRSSALKIVTIGLILRRYCRI